MNTYLIIPVCIFLSLQQRQVVYYLLITKFTYHCYIKLADDRHFDLFPFIFFQAFTMTICDLTMHINIFSYLRLYFEVVI